MSLFNITWRTQVINLLPNDIRGVSPIDYITSLLEPLKTKATEWFSFDVEIRKRAKFNAQIVVLGAALNEIYGIASAPFIYIETVVGSGSTVFIHNDTEIVDFTYIYNLSESTPTYIYNLAEINDDYEFVVFIPIGVHTATLERQIINEVNTYKLAGKRFITQTY
jgi:hypothetical protein